MPTKHIDDLTWHKVEKATIKAVIELQAAVKDTEVLKWLILKGLEEFTPEEFGRFKRKGEPPEQQQKRRAAKTARA